jgi:hypothetical protein
VSFFGNVHVEPRWLILQYDDRKGKYRAEDVVGGVTKDQNALGGGAGGAAGAYVFSPPPYTQTQHPLASVQTNKFATFIAQYGRWKSTVHMTMHCNFVLIDPHASQLFVVFFVAQRFCRYGGGYGGGGGGAAVAPAAPTGPPADGKVCARANLCCHFQLVLSHDLQKYPSFGI